MNILKACLVAYSSPYGQTKAISEAIVDRLRVIGVNAKSMNIDDVKDFDVDLIVVGLPVYISEFQRHATRWLDLHVDQLNRARFSFFSVSASAGGTDPSKLRALDQLVDKYLAKHKLKPSFVQNLAGAIHYRKYNFLIRWIMKRICASEGCPTDTSKNHVLTNWDRVTQFANESAKLLKNGAVTP